MGMVGRLGKILGRRGLMPNPKSGTITFDIERAMREVKGGRVEFKVDKGGIIHMPFGKVSFEAAQIVDNLAALVDAINRARPSAAKGHYFKSLTVASTMGPGIRVDVPARPRQGRLKRAGAGRPRCRGDAAPTIQQDRSAKDSVRPRRGTRCVGQGPSTRTGDADGHAEAGSDVTGLPWCCSRSRPASLCGTSHRGVRLAGATTKGGSMPTEAKRATVAELTDALSRPARRRSWPTTAA